MKAKFKYLLEDIRYLVYVGNIAFVF